MNWEPKVGQTQEEWLAELLKEEQAEIEQWAKNPNVRNNI